MAFASSSPVQVPQEPDGFEQCISDIQGEARKAGVSEETVVNVLGNSKFVSNVIKYDRSQPEFVQTFTNYFGKRVNDWRINRGRELYKEHQALLQKLAAQYGVPAHYLVAFWGLETNFGNYKGKMPIIDSLTTLACDPRRSKFFESELIQALLLMDRENIDVETMLGSWAGAMGHTQFMPSAYMRYAVDGDNDGKADLWNSIPDALTSAANFLSNLGWERGYRWGREVRLPENFDYQLSGKDQHYDLTFWGKQGLTQINGKPLGKGDLKASLLVPAGHKGPAFLVYDNFDVIMKWNRSEFYAIAVGHLADRISGQEQLSKPLPELPIYTLDDVRQLQSTLNQLGFDVGSPDGIMGPATRKGIRDFQASIKLTADGFPDNQVFQALKQAASINDEPVSQVQ
ncbi:lytic murein transglycosylase [Paraneptunicella aestuarii]|uniref:lytic murein transglycosylase n=1 Tax=Paraneptunicella aestuarii TaxID=2831148 RepID=UPI001E4514BE|nr:lytic murein transglycosylase [Paraneptunicella aestuarii]UAA40835.1 lytic murein transglycosylase [Paraneptunicella aestuarii]